MKADVMAEGGMDGVTRALTDRLSETAYSAEDQLENVGQLARSPQHKLHIRVQEELECLNASSQEINKLETELEHARAKFRSLLTESTSKMKLLYKKLGRCVNKTRPYYELVKEARKSQAEAQKAVVNYQRSNSIYRAAKETVALAEERMLDTGQHGQDKREFDSAWQEVLNHATMKFMDSEKEKAKSEQEHLTKAAQYAEIQHRLKAMEKDMPRNIAKSRPYFEMKEKLEFQLQQEKFNVEDLQRGLQSAKVRYRGALMKLESISDEVHLKRRLSQELPPRTPGVGAENPGDAVSDLPSISLDIKSDTCSILSEDFLDVETKSTGSFSMESKDSTDLSCKHHSSSQNIVANGHIERTFLKNVTQNHCSQPAVKDTSMNHKDLCNREDSYRIKVEQSQQSRCEVQNSELGNSRLQNEEHDLKTESERSSSTSESKGQSADQDKKAPLQSSQDSNSQNGVEVCESETTEGLDSSNAELLQNHDISNGVKLKRHNLPPGGSTAEKTVLLPTEGAESCHLIKDQSYLHVHEPNNVDNVIKKIAN